MANNPEALQLRLFQEEGEPAPWPESNGSGLGDPNFALNKGLPIHRWVPWIAGFSSGFVQGALRKYLAEPGTVLDPFAGVGTTIVDAILLGHRAIGFEINPYAALACRVKATAYCIPVPELYHEIARFPTFYRESMAGDYTPRTLPPAGFRTRSPFYSPCVLRQVLIVQDFIKGISDAARISILPRLHSWLVSNWCGLRCPERSG
ncbi:MAG: DNA methyltransferase [Chloroflexia bacterium]